MIRALVAIRRGGLFRVRMRRTQYRMA